MEWKILNLSESFLKKFQINNLMKRRKFISDIAKVLVPLGIIGGATFYVKSANEEIENDLLRKRMFQGILESYDPSFSGVISESYKLVPDSQSENLYDIVRVSSDDAVPEGTDLLYKLCFYFIISWAYLFFITYKSSDF